MTTFSAFRIHADKTSHRAGVEEMKLDDLSPGEVVIKVAYSSVNYKDALAGSGKGKILRRSPLNGGIDVSGTVVSSTDPDFKEGDEVLCTGSGLSETHDGGYAQYARLESKWTIPLPKGLSLREAMVIGTAGFTAALSLYRMEQNGQVPAMGPIVVSGATGGVGQLAIDILTKAGYEAHAISGKFEHFDDLIALGAKQCISTQGFVLGPASARIDEVGGRDRQRRRRSVVGTDARDPSLRQHRQLRKRRGDRTADDGDAVHPARRESARHRLGGNGAQHTRRNLAASRLRLEAGASGQNCDERSFARSASAGVRQDDARRVVRTNGSKNRLISVLDSATSIAC